MIRREVDKTFEEKTLEISRVSRTVKGGKRISFRALVVLGDKKGQVGIGVGKASEVSLAIRKASTFARKHLKRIAISDAGSVPKEVLVKFGSANILFKPSKAGSSIIAGGVIRSIAELAGIKNLVSKSLGSSNKINCAKATIIGLLEAGKR